MADIGYLCAIKIRRNLKVKLVGNPDVQKLTFIRIQFHFEHLIQLPLENTADLSVGNVKYHQNLIVFATKHSR